MGTKKKDYVLSTFFFLMKDKDNIRDIIINYFMTTALHCGIIFFFFLDFGLKILGLSGGKFLPNKGSTSVFLTACLDIRVLELMYTLQRFHCSLYKLLRITTIRSPWKTVHKRFEILLQRRIKEFG